MTCKTILCERVEIHDPEILALVEDLGLVPGRRPLFFCEEWKCMFENHNRKVREEIDAMYARYHDLNRRGRKLKYYDFCVQKTLPF